MNRLGLKYKDRKKRLRRLFLFSGIFFILIYSSLCIFFPKSIVVIPPEPAPPLHITEGDIKEKSTLYQSLVENNVPFRWIDLIISKLNPFVDFRNIKAGTYRFIADVEGKLVKFVLEAGPTEIYKIEKDVKGEYIAQRQEVPLEIYLVKIVGEIHSSLFEAMNAIGEHDQLTISFAEILAWEIDFYKDVKEGDRFKLVMQKIYKGDQFMQYGTIDAVEYQRGGRVIRGIRFKGDYYNGKGISLKKAFLKAPLRFNRISSRFSRARRHPILGGVRPHYGIDYSAPSGTPVWAVADGTVVSAGWNRGFGKQVTLRHRNGYKTYYGHLSRYGPGIKKGKRVKQKQIIGYVGSTGISTGPHLDYRLSKNGRVRNPLKETFPGGSRVREKDLGAFQKRKNEILAWLTDHVPYQKRLEETTSDAIQRNRTDRGHWQKTMEISQIMSKELFKIL